MKLCPTFRFSYFGKSFFCWHCQELRSLQDDKLWQNPQKIAFACNKLSLQVGLKIVPISLVILILQSCASVEKHNQHLEKYISPQLLKKDIDFVQKKLTKHQPNLDWYIPKDSLNLLFENLKNNLSKPLKPNDFFLELSPIISSIKQGHTRLGPLNKRLSKQESKRLKQKGLGPLSQFDVVFFNDSLYISKNKSPDSTIQVGTQILKIDDVCPTQLYKKYVKTVSSDGFNQTYYRHWFNRSFGNYFTLSQGVKDSLKFELKIKDSIFKFTTYRLDKSTKKSVKKDLVKAKKPNKKELSALKKKKKIYGWVNNQFAKELVISKVDSTIAVLHIRSFSQGKHRKAYKAIFDEIDRRKIKHLIIDLRNNPGGKIIDNVILYSYLTDKPFVMNKKSKVVSRSSMVAPMFNHSPKWLYPLTAVGFPFFASYQWLNTTKNQSGELMYNAPGSDEVQPKSNAYLGDLYVLINGGSFSASSFFSAKLHADKRAIFFGEETGGAYNGTVAGLNLNYKLPYSKLGFKLWTMDIRMLDEIGEHGKGVMPDHEIKQDLNKILTDADEDLEEIINYIKTKAP